MMLEAVLAATFVRPPALHGRASWYDDGPGLYAAAGPELRRWLGPDWRGSTVTVAAGDRSVSVRLTDWCYCYRNSPSERLVDLSPAAFLELEVLEAGLVRVRITEDW